MNDKEPKKFAKKGVEEEIEQQRDGQSNMEVAMKSGKVKKGVNRRTGRMRHEQDRE